jgi:hypothetical protein
MFLSRPFPSARTSSTDVVETSVTVPTKTADASRYAWQGGAGTTHEQAKTLDDSDE